MATWYGTLTCGAGHPWERCSGDDRDMVLIRAYLILKGAHVETFIETSSAVHCEHCEHEPDARVAAPEPAQGMPSQALR
jgi:hypothetical protein